MADSIRVIQAMVHAQITKSTQLIPVQVCEVDSAMDHQHTAPAFII
jgi:hypothetical protein